MGIDIYLKWPGMTEEDKARQYNCGFSTTDGHIGYLREAYHGGPYATKILCREAFESDSNEAEISAAVLRSRLTNLTEPAYGCDGGHNIAVMLASLLTGVKQDAAAGTTVLGLRNPDGRTTPMSVEKAVRTRYKNLYPEDDPEIVVQSFRNFVALAEQKEAEHGRPCTVYASH